ncbi:MAG: TolB family protein, partial [Fimbriimonadales bacterium]
NGTAGTLPANVILYSRGDGVTSTVYRVNPDGSNTQVFASLPASYAAFAASPADSRVAFAHTPGGLAYGVFVNTSVDVAGATTVDPGPYIFVGSMQFTPDGSKVIYVAQGASGNSGLFVANANGSGSPLRLDDADDAALGQGGTEIVYSRLFSSEHVCLRKIDGTGFAQVTTGASNNFLAQWSKDGQNLFFTSDRSGANAIWTMKWDGSNPARITSGLGEYGSSPNGAGSLIAFTRIAVDTTKTGVYTVGVDGTGEAPVIKTTDVEQSIYWTSANGRAVGTGGVVCLQQLSPRLRRLVARR